MASRSISRRIAWHGEDVQRGQAAATASRMPRCDSCSIAPSTSPVMPAMSFVASLTAAIVSAAAASSAAKLVHHGVATPSATNAISVQASAHHVHNVE